MSRPTTDEVLEMLEAHALNVLKAFPDHVEAKDKLHLVRLAKSLRREVECYSALLAAAQKEIADLRYGEEWYK